MNLNAITNASKSIQMNGRTYHVSPLNDRMMAELDNYIRAEFIRSAADAADKVQNNRIADRIIDRALKQSTAINVFTEEGSELLSTINGLTYMIYLSMKPNHPEITVEEIYKAISEDDKLQTSLPEIFAELNIEPLKQAMGSDNMEAKVDAAKKKRQDRKKELRKKTGSQK